MRGLALGAAALACVAFGCGEQSETQTTAPSTGGSEPALEEIGEFEEPVYLTQPPDGDGTLYVVERAGAIRALSPEGEVAGRPFLDVSRES
jgi:hypothetical protein